MSTPAQESDGGDMLEKLHLLTPELLNSITAYSAATSSKTPAHGDDADRVETERRERIVEAAQAIVDAARPPQPEWMNQSTAGAEFVALRLFIEWGAFEVIPVEGSISYEDLAHEMDAEVQLLTGGAGAGVKELREKTDGESETNTARLAWLMVSSGLLEQVGEDRVRHTPKSRQLTESVPLRSMWQLMFDNSFTSSASLPRYFRTYGRREPKGLTHIPFTFAHGAPEKKFWDVLNAEPGRMQVFMHAMTAIDKQVPLMGPITGLYDFGWVADVVADEKKKSSSSDHNRPLLVDVGGGKGHCIKAFCAGEDSPLSQDRCVLQDVAPVIEVVRSDEASGLAGVTLMAIDFHVEQPVKGALIYYIRHCLHNYDDDTVVGIMKRTAEAMADDSRLLVAEYVMSNPPSRFSIWMDFIMMMSGGKERTAALWEEVGSRAGLRLVAFHGIEVSLDGHAVIEFAKR
ncbi:S-adenosyl-L-methionine-dependent methyltransferase [Sodiomyces alkalinus F11]|uniref:S-adenosyl-L-methionine-dependent methyltransferase n=1 Tax=Sodiomyces alkalinus (strain CBS 110278 / VKM F-3762 / F11) TaxID=1314773 RepID=A0A3N2Q2P8_SODAK|nr:S-adenosyl-L-methionine-dependent methyltransferase [Sodiomyces alkalinus F11]ROT41044.1 S-adenosyl-L-methionine-dependent methyltransferase [Sodiomyces alkalinus F11]